MLNYPRPGDTIRVCNVQRKRDCRAYRVFRYYINELVCDEYATMANDENVAEIVRQVEALDSVFLCKEDSQGRGCKVFTCTHCKYACRRRDNDGKLYYAQCNAAELDLFDGFKANGQYESIGIGEQQAPEYAACSVEDRLALSVLRMANATFKGYGGAGYVHSGGGGLLTPGDFDGMASLLVRGARGSTREAGSPAVQRRALRQLLDPYSGNPLVRRMLTCIERDLDGAQTTMPREDESDSDSDDSDSDSESAGGGCGDNRAESSGHDRCMPMAVDDAPTFLGAVESCLPLDPAAQNAHLAANPTVGDKRHRSGSTSTQPLDVDKPRASADNAANTVLFPRGAGGRADTEAACTHKHYRRKMLGSVADVFGRASEFIWYHYQQMVKRSMQQGGSRTVNPHLVINATRGDVSEHTAALCERWAALREAAPEYVPYCTVAESYTGTVGANVIGSKAYWDEAGAELMAMAIEYDPPQYWATFTENENGWSDLKAACRGEHHSKRPMEATRHYNRRWEAFLKQYLTGVSPKREMMRADE